MFNTEKFNELVENKGLSIDALAEASGVSRQMIWLLRQGRSTDVKLSTLNGLAAALDIDPSELNTAEAA